MARRLRTERYVGHRCTKIALMELWQETTGLPGEWPENVVPFTGKNVTAADALKESNNAVAVKVLKDYGVGEVGSFFGRYARL